MKTRITATIKPFREVFPDIDLREFEAMRVLCGDLYDIEITVNGAKYSMSLQDAIYEIKDLVNIEEIEDDTIYNCIPIRNGNTIDSIRRLYGKWLKDFKTDNEIPYKDDFEKIMKQLNKYDEQKIYEEKMNSKSYNILTNYQFSGEKYDKS